MKEFAKFYEDVVSWNARAGVKDHEFRTLDWDRAVELQCKLLVEESKEAYDAIQHGDYVELLDGAIDNLVIAFKLVDMLDKAGFDIVGAFQQVIDNNEKKVFNSFYEACEAKEKLEERDDVEFYVETAVHNGMPYYTVRQMSGKIAKSVDFIPVELSDYVP